MTDITFDEAAAAVYDAAEAAIPDPAPLEPVIDVLADLAGGDGGSALELAIGTGRIALPLAARGVEVHGIDESQPMVDRLRAKPGGAEVPVTIGDMATTDLGRRFDLVYLVYNTISNLTDQDGQVACFRNAADHLRPGGVFVVECCFPELRRLLPGETIRMFSHGPGYVGYEDFAEWDPVGQRAWSRHWWDVDGRTSRFDSLHRTVWPSELDLMARLAGLRLRDRWADWDRSAVTAASTGAVSVWETPEA